MIFILKQAKVIKTNRNSVDCYSYSFGNGKEISNALTVAINWFLSFLAVGPTYLRIHGYGTFNCSLKHYSAISRSIVRKPFILMFSLRDSLYFTLIKYLVTFFSNNQKTVRIEILFSSLLLLVVCVDYDQKSLFLYLLF